MSCNCCCMKKYKGDPNPLGFRCRKIHKYLPVTLNFKPIRYGHTFKTSKHVENLLLKNKYMCSF